MQTKFIAGHGQSRAAVTSVRIARNRWQHSQEPAIRSPETEAGATMEAARSTSGRPGR